MKDFQGRKPWHRAVWAKVIILVMVIMVFFLSKAVWGVYGKSQIARANKDKSASELAELEKEKQELERRVRWLSSERGQEEEIRKNFSMAREGEKVFIIVDGPDDHLPIATTTPKKTGWRALVETLKGLWAF